MATLTKKGFIVNRFTIKRDGVLLSIPEKILLTPKPLLAVPLEKWMDIIQKDNNAAIIAQSLYGESFQVTDSKEGEVSKIVNIAAELDQRYTFALYAADMNFEASVMAAWGLVDMDVKSNEIYAYQVSVFENTKVKPSTYVVGLKDFEPLPAPTDFIGISDDKKIVFSWDYQTFKKIYSSYMIEKSENGTDFKPISKTNIVNLNDDSTKSKNNMYYADTIADNSRIYHYRLYGISPFGEKGQYTKVMQIQGIGALKSTPRLLNYKISAENSVEIVWEYEQKEEINVEHFEVNQSNTDGGKYKIVSERLPANTRQYTIKNLEPSNYFTITVTGKNKQRFTSQSMLVQPIDSLPPSIPLGLEGVIDSLGVVKIKWKANTEKDLLGYRVLRANTKNEEFIDIFHKAYEKTEFQDKVSLTMSNENVYYRIISEDKRHNLSKPCETLTIVKPDKIQPTAPIFKDFESKNGKIKLQWIRSYSNDVDYHILKRRQLNQTKWEDVLRINDTIKQDYVDSNVEKNKTYQYAIIAVDKNKLKSTLDNSIITVQAQDFRPTKIITNFVGIADRENRKITLTWDYSKNNEKVVGVSIYKNIVGEAPTLLRELPSKIVTLVDENLKINNDYEYHISLSLQSNNPARVENTLVKY